jgi:hypothetical protein
VEGVPFTVRSFSLWKNLLSPKNITYQYVNEIIIAHSRLSRSQLHLSVWISSKLIELSRVSACEKIIDNFFIIQKKEDEKFSSDMYISVCCS